MLDFTTNIEATPGEYSMEISLGTLPQKFVAIADTGSDLVWLECKACTVCMNASAVFDPSVPLFHLQPAGMQRVQCPRQQRGHLHAQLPVHVRIRRSIDDPGRFLPRHSHSAEHERHLHGHRQSPPSSTTLTNSPTACSRATTPLRPAARSPLLFGKSAVPTNVSFTVFTPQLTPYEPSVVPFYYVNLTDISVGGAALNIPASAFAIDTQGNGGVIFDSGTTYTLLNTVAYRSVVDTFTSQIGTTYPRVNLLSLTGLEVCYNTTALSNVSAPNVVFNFDGADFDLPSENIVILFTTTGTDTVMCLASLQSISLHVGFAAILVQNMS
ncbi:hypothetical protein MPTK1_6g08240 [Marchantia polymorpha subsp. ruderalis]|uniref:Peptidase A1 domain-containing protein n=2 Tax=Marchantia polymorpha TaxID=3197 RepID=A0AAF6BPT5_MARPO|nr:hypothetical protein MARPO_0060s0097 [Marchantia polymorpha]BBN14019.1 hypothetical protein Mp_6g08240 [Marchantia polymorpha subsp. ruderalis]|eukprot:PTQ37026.1 hypothetical protein MARPO_0060s0097 [Marchantia polymorpha]